MGTTVSKGDAVITVKSEKHEPDDTPEKTRVHKSVSSSIIEEKERRRQKELNEPETQMAITEAEKMLEIYRKEMKGTTEITPKEKRAAFNRPKQDIYNRPKQQYKTSDYDDRGRATPIPRPRSEAEPSESKSREIPTTINDTIQKTVQLYHNNEYVSLAIIPGYDETTVVPKCSEKHEEKEEKQTKDEDPNLQEQDPVKPPKSPDEIKQKKSPEEGKNYVKDQGSILTKNVSQYCPTLLDQRRDVASTTPLKPLTHGMFNSERQKVRLELENQGLVAPGSYTEATKQGILYELKDVGIIQKDTKYTMSSGSPVRKPPPRLSQLPPLNTPPATKALEITFKEFGRPLLSVKDKDFTFVDYGRPVQAKSGQNIPGTEKAVSLTKQFAEIRNTENETQNGPTVTTENEYLVTHSGANIGDANKVKLKMFDLDTL
ncbi:MAG: hypothetical protein AB2693_15520 [Candidatus Thiodiazotropha sp.]